MQVFSQLIQFAIRGNILIVLTLFSNNLLEKPTIWKSPPKFKSTVLNETAIAGDRVRLQCEVDGMPEPVITWRKDSQILSPDNNVIIAKSPFKSVLTITQVSKSDHGKYSCKASNRFGPPIEAHGSLVIEDRSKYCSQCLHSDITERASTTGIEPRYQK